MTLDELYSEYGKLTINFKILQGKISQAEQQIVAELQKTNPQTTIDDVKQKEKEK